ncbi:MAG TPA: hypothetical protein VGR02_20840 [Thermoanaerobaculia bacterium]|jgi:hypothetical protein|nr:hypothetical protein [Thermoanaerobaculia bacterium]
MRKWIVVVALGRAMVPAAFAASELTYQIPDGWIDLTDPYASTDNIPPFVVQEARSGKYLHYAVDPRMVTAQGAQVSFNALEQAGSGRLTNATLHQTAAEMTSGVASSGFTMNVMEMKLQKLGGVDIGVITSIMETPRGNLQLVQYMIPGKTRIAVLTYGCPPAELDRYRPIFESSAMATTGAYNHAGLFDIKRIAMAGLLGGLAAAVIAVISVSLSRNKKTAPAPISPSTPLLWDCPTCKRRVPMRIDACRCGAPRP